MPRDQLEVLSALDQAKTQWYHFTAIIIAGMGFFTDAYDLFCISCVTKLLGRIYYYQNDTKGPGLLPANVNAAVTGVALCGTLAGQLFFGWLGDKMGRKRVYGITLMIMMISAIGCGLSFGKTATSVMTTICFFRFWLGFGIGGDYPLSATIMSEYANQRTRGAFIAAVFAMQGFGLLAGGAVSIIVAKAFGFSHGAGATFKPPAKADFVWRIVFMFGAVPAAVTFYWRMKMPETARFTALVARNAKQAAADMSKVLEVDIHEDQNVIDAMTKDEDRRFSLLSWAFLQRHGLHLLGTMTTWFFLDIAYYSQNLFQSEIYTDMNWLPAATAMNAIEEVFKVARAQSLIALFSTVPGYWFTVFFVDRIGRFTIQLMGFFFMTVFMFAAAIPYNHWIKDNPHALLALYSFTFFFSNFGPNSTTFIVPAEIFPARLRSTCHGISAAAGKAGAIIGSFGFLYASQLPNVAASRAKGYPPGIGIQKSLLIMGGVNALGFIFTFFVPESKGKSLEDLSGENEEGLEITGSFARSNQAITV